MIKRFIIAIILLVIVVGGLVGFNLFRDKAISDFFANMPRPASAVSTAKVETVTWTPVISAIGTVGAAKGVDLTVETTGIVASINFASNQKVQQGDVLVQLDDAVQRADVAAAQSQASLDQQTLDRALELQRRGVGADSNVDAARAAASASTSQVTKLQAVLDQKQLRAPFSGTIGIPRIDDGQYLSPGTVVATLQDLDTMRADFSVPEQQLPQVKIGQPVRMGLSEDAMEFEGQIVGIDPKVDPSTRLVSIRADIRNPQGRLSPGQFVQVRIELPTEPNIVAIPQTALIASLYGDYVYAVKPAPAPAAGTQAPAAAQAPAEAAAPAADGQAAPAQPAADQPSLVASQIFVKIGRRNGGLVEVTEGLAAGDEVVTAGQNRLSNGGPVRIENQIQPAANASASAQ